MAVHLGSLLRPKPRQFSVGSLLRPKPFAVLRWVLFQAEACPIVPWIAASTEVSAVLRWVLFQAEACPIIPWIAASTEVSAVLRWIAVWIEIRPVLLRKDVLAEASSSLLLDSRRDRSLWQVSRIPAWAEALAVHRSVFRFRPKPWRFTCPESPFRPKPIGVFRPARMSAEAGTLSGLAPGQSRSSGGLPPKRRASRSRSVSSVRIPVGAEALPVHLWRFREAEASGSTGLLDEPCRPCKSEGQARCVRMAAASSAALAVTSQTFTCDPIRSVSGCSLVLRPEGRSTRPQLEPVMGIRVVKADSACG